MKPSGFWHIAEKFHLIFILWFIFADESAIVYGEKKCHLSLVWAAWNATVVNDSQQIDYI